MESESKLDDCQLGSDGTKGDIAGNQRLVLWLRRDTGPSNRREHGPRYVVPLIRHFRGETYARSRNCPVFVRLEHFEQCG